MSLLILPPARNYSRGITPTAPGTTFVTNYQGVNATDDSSGTVAKLTSLTGVFSIDLGALRFPTVVGLINHTYDDGLVLTLVGSTVSDFASLTSSTLRAATKPNVWFDLRSYAAVGQRYFRITPLSANSRTIALGEWVIGLADEYGGVLEPGYDRAGRGFAERNYTEYGVLIKVTSGCEYRALKLQTRLPPDERAWMAATFADAGTAGQRVLVVPDTAQEDVFWVDWPSLMDRRVPHHLEHGIPLDLPEEMAGIV